MKANKKKNPKWNLSPWSPPKCKKWIYKHAPPPFYLEEQKLITRHPQTPRQSHRNPRCNLCQLVLPSVSSPCLSPPTICHPRNSSPFVLSLLLKLLVSCQDAVQTHVLPPVTHRWNTPRACPTRAAKTWMLSWRAVSC